MHKKLLELAEPYLEKNELGVGHTIRVLDIAKKNYHRYRLSKFNREIVFSLIVLHDVGGSSIRAQYQKGPVIAKRLLERLKCPALDISIICMIITKHHERLENPDDLFKILYDSDRLAMFSGEEFIYYNANPGFRWKDIITSFYDADVRNSAKKLLNKRMNENGKKKDNKNQ